MKKEQIHNIISIAFVITGSLFILTLIASVWELIPRTLTIKLVFTLGILCVVTMLVGKSTEP